MEIVVIAALILAAPYVFRAYFRLARRCDGGAMAAWPLVERHARVLLEDKRLSPVIGDMVEALVVHAGDGRLTRAFLANVILRRRRRVDENIQAAINGLNQEQEKQFLHFLATVLFFDSFTTPVAGIVLRRVVYWLAVTARDRSAPISRVQVEPAVSAAGRMCMAG